MSVDEFITEACRLNRRLDESSGRLSTFKVLTAVKNNVKDADDVQKFMDKYENQIQYAEDTLTGKKKSVFMRAVSCIWYAIKKSTSFILKHWRLVLLAILVVVLFIWLGASGPGYALGAKLFGQGNAWNAISTKLVTGAKVKASTIASVISSWIARDKPVDDSVVFAQNAVDAAEAKLGYKPTSWEVVDDNDVMNYDNDNDVHIDFIKPNVFFNCGKTKDGDPVWALVDKDEKIVHLKPVK